MTRPVLLDVLAAAAEREAMSHPERLLLTTLGVTAALLALGWALARGDQRHPATPPFDAASWDQIQQASTLH